MNDRKVIGTSMSGQPIYALEGRGSAAANRMFKGLEILPDSIEDEDEILEMV